MNWILSAILYQNPFKLIWFKEKNAIFSPPKTSFLEGRDCQKGIYLSTINLYRNSEEITPNYRGEDKEEEKLQESIELNPQWDKSKCESYSSRLWIITIEQFLMWKQVHLIRPLLKDKVRPWRILNTIYGNPSSIHMDNTVLEKGYRWCFLFSVFLLGIRLSRIFSILFYLSKFVLEWVFYFVKALFKKIVLRMPKHWVHFTSPVTFITREHKIICCRSN